MLHCNVKLNISVKLGVSVCFFYLLDEECEKKIKFEGDLMSLGSTVAKYFLILLALRSLQEGALTKFHDLFFCFGAADEEKFTLLLRTLLPSKNACVFQWYFKMWGGNRASFWASAHFNFSMLVRHYLSSISRALDNYFLIKFIFNLNISFMN